MVQFKEEIVQEIKLLSKGIGYVLGELLDPWKEIGSESKSQVENSSKFYQIPIPIMVIKFLKKSTVWF